MTTWTLHVYRKDCWTIYIYIYKGVVTVVTWTLHVYRKDFWTMYMLYVHTSIHMLVLHTFIHIDQNSQLWHMTRVNLCRHIYCIQSWIMYMHVYYDITLNHVVPPHPPVWTLWHLSRLFTFCFSVLFIYFWRKVDIIEGTKSENSHCHWLSCSYPTQKA